jgi:aldose 1-epimerase
MSKIILENKTLQLTVDSDEGAGVAAFFVKQGGALLPIFLDSSKKTHELNCSNFLMIPYSNRVEDGKFTFEGKEHQLKTPVAHAMHGDVKDRPWSIEKVSKTSVCCSFDFRKFQVINWPWHFSATVEYTLLDNILHSKIILKNESDSNMPAGVGWHPFFSRALTCEGEPVYLCMQVENEYPDANGNRIPSGPPQPLAANHDFSKEKELLKDDFFDTCFTGYNGNGTITWPESKVRLHFKCSLNCKHLVMFNPNMPYFCIEPVTNATNGFNLLAQGDKDSGIVVLAPQEKLTAEFNIIIEASS